MYWRAQLASLESRPNTTTTTKNTGVAVIPTMGSEADSAGARAGAARFKARRTDASSTPGRTIDRNGTDDEDFEDTPELASSKRRGSSGTAVARPELAAVGSVRLSASEA